MAEPEFVFCRGEFRCSTPGLSEDREAGSIHLNYGVLAEHTDRLAASTLPLLTIRAPTITKLAALLDPPHSEKPFKEAC